MDTKMKKIDVVVVTYNRCSLLQECIAAIIQERKALDSVIIVNNNSTDGTLEYLQQLEADKLFDIRNLNENIGGAAGFEYGIKLAMESHTGSYIWIMDDDTIPQPGAARALIDASTTLRENFGFLCSNVLWKDGTPTNIPDTDENWPEMIDQNLIKVKRATFVSVFVRRETVATVGLPIGKMKIWGDDTEYTTRLHDFADSYFVANSIVLHKTVNNLMNDTIQNISTDRIWRYHAMYRNLMYTYRKFYGPKEIIKYTGNGLLTSLKGLTASSHRLHRSYAVLSGTISGYFFNPKINFPNNTY